MARHAGSWQQQPAATAASTSALGSRPTAGRMSGACRMGAPPSPLPPKLRRGRARAPLSPLVRLPPSPSPPPPRLSRCRSFSSGASIPPLSLSSQLPSFALSAFLFASGRDGLSFCQMIYYRARPKSGGADLPPRVSFLSYSVLRSMLPPHHFSPLPSSLVGPRCTTTTSWQSLCPGTPPSLISVHLCRRRVPFAEAIAGRGSSVAFLHCNT